MSNFVIKDTLTGTRNLPLYYYTHVCTHSSFWSRDHHNCNCWWQTKNK